MERLPELFVCAGLLGFLSPTPTVCGQETVDLRAFRTIAIPSAPHELERSMADLLQAKLEDLYGLELEITPDSPAQGHAAILLGRETAMAARMVSEGELAAVKYDGYVMKGTAGRVALVGFEPQGTAYATYAFLRRAGLKLYPWRNFGAVEVREPVEGGKLKAFDVSNTPFFARRDLLSWLDRGRWGASFRTWGGLGEFRFVHEHEWFKGKGWLGGDHSAPYLVPMGKYHDAHPEYFAMKGGKRIPKDTQNCRVAICMSNPDVHRIATERALEWMEIQKERRFFHVTDGDTSECRCPACVAVDPLPDAYTDRYLRWVNSVARTVSERFPDKVIQAIAYGGSTQPPVEVAPEPNVVVMYAPWYWNSRTTSAVTWANPLNITAMKEFMAWAVRLPDQMALYDYPGAWVQGQADRIKFLAKNNVRVFYSCGGRGDLFQWVNVRLLWDPFLNTEDLIDEFVRAYYGPAAGPMAGYLRLRQDAIDRSFVHDRDAFSRPDFVARTRELMREASRLAETADDGCRARVVKDVLAGLELVLEKSHPRTGVAGVRASPPEYATDLVAYVRLSGELLGLYQALGNRYAVRVQKEAFGKSMARFGLDVPAAEGAGQTDRGDAAVFDRTVASWEDQVRKLGPPATDGPEEAPRVQAVDFGAEGEVGKWLSDGSQAALILPPERAGVQAPSGSELQGVKVTAPLSRLPVIGHHSLKIHAGRFYAERAFDPPLDATGCPYLDVRLHATCDVPVTVYVDSIHSDIDLHAGEQIVRVDLRNYRGTRFDYDGWDGKISRVSFDIWPQDNYRPFPTVCDVSIVFIGLTLSNQTPTPESLPHRGRAIWLSQFRPNVPRGVTVPRELYDTHMQRQQYRHVGLDYGSRWVSEKFRTFTEHRSVCPIFSILTGEEAAPGESEAALGMQRFLHQRFGVRLPVNPSGVAPGRDTGNVVVIGRRACLDAGLVREEELGHVGHRGFVINAHNGRVAVAGHDDLGTQEGVVRYLRDHGCRFFVRGVMDTVGADDPWLHELYLLDWPVFRKDAGGGWWLATGPGRIWSAAMEEPGDVAFARELARLIKSPARSGQTEHPLVATMLAERSALSEYVARSLLWDPFADSSRLIREFREAEARRNE